VFRIGSIELLGVLTDEVHLRVAFWGTMANFNINVAGFCIAEMFILVWTAALAYWCWVQSRTAGSHHAVGGGRRSRTLAARAGLRGYRRRRRRPGSGESAITQLGRAGAFEVDTDTAGCDGRFRLSDGRKPVVTVSAASPYWDSGTARPARNLFVRQAAI